MDQRWAEMTVEAEGDAQEAVGALLVSVAGCHGWASTPSLVSGYLPVDERLEGALLALRDGLSQLDGGPLAPTTPHVTVRFVEEADWANAWKEYFKPQRIGDRIVIKPTWEKWTPGPRDVIVELDPGMAFGTGLHATTRLCLRALESDVRAGDRVADVGTGSGVLAIAAALLGASRVAAVDIDPLAVRVARENVALNGVAEAVQVEESDVPPAGQFDIVVANILAGVIVDMAPVLRAALRSEGVLIASGIIDTRAAEVRDGLSAAGFARIDTRAEGEWVALRAVAA